MNKKNSFVKSVEMKMEIIIINTIFQKKIVNIFGLKI